MRNIGFLKGVFRIRNDTRVFTLDDSNILSLLGITDSTKEALGETTYFIALQHLSQTLSKIPRYVYTRDHKKGRERADKGELEYLLNVEPNSYYSATTLWASVELNRLHYGNAYVYIERSDFGIKHLWLLPTTDVQIYMDDAGIFGKTNAIYYVYTDSKTLKRYTFFQYEILHYKTHMSFDGITGLATKDIISTQINSLKYSEEFQGKLFKSNMFGSKVILQYTGEMGSGAKDTLIKETERYANAVGSGKYLPLPIGITATTLDMKLSDAEFVELNKLSSLQLAACFGIKPNVTNNYDKSSYSNSETQQLDFYVNTLQPIFKMYNDEDTIKLIPIKEKIKGTAIELDKEVLFELDKQTQMEILVKGLNNFITTPNEAREKIGYPYVDDENANKLYGNGNLIELSRAGEGTNYGEGGENE
ncbi:MAG: phage portal protein [Lachnospiraceae bacterium]|nr:phage portal protein [Lachnospiraceae bacterium]